jgi:hypothetical protein
MKKVEIVNNKTGQQYGARFDDDIKMQAWIGEQVKAESWGRGERILNEKQAIGAGLDIKDAIEIIVRQEEINEGDGPVLVDVNYYRFAPEYDITITDITAQDNAEKQARIDKENLKANIIARAKTVTTLPEIRLLIADLVAVIYE